MWQVSGEHEEAEPQQVLPARLRWVSSKRSEKKNERSAAARRCGEPKIYNREHRSRNSVTSGRPWHDAESGPRDARPFGGSQHSLLRSRRVVSIIERHAFTPRAAGVTQGLRALREALARPLPRYSAAPPEGTRGKAKFSRLVRVHRSGSRGKKHTLDSARINLRQVRATEFSSWK